MKIIDYLQKMNYNTEDFWNIMGEKKRNIIKLLAKAKSPNDIFRIRKMYSMTEHDIERFREKYHNEIETERFINNF